MLVLQWFVHLDQVSHHRYMQIMQLPHLRDSPGHSFKHLYPMYLSRENIAPRAVFKKKRRICVCGVFSLKKTYSCVISCKYAWVCSYDVLLVDFVSRNSGLPNCGEGCNLISQSGFQRWPQQESEEEEMNTWCQYQPTNVLKRTDANETDPRHIDAVVVLWIHGVRRHQWSSNTGLSSTALVFQVYHWY